MAFVVSKAKRVEDVEPFPPAYIAKDRLPPRPKRAR
jgi:hypothetical protein